MVTKTNWWLFVLVFVVGALGLVIGGQQGIKEGYEKGYQDGLVATANISPPATGITYNNGVLTYDDWDKMKSPDYDANQSELAQQIMDFLGQASKVDISLKGGKDTGGTLDVHLEFTK